MRLPFFLVPVSWFLVLPGHYGHYGGGGHCCCGVWMYNAHETLFITFVHFLLV